MKDLIANEEMIKAHNDDISNKLRQQKEDYDKLLSGKMEAEEILRLETQRLTEDTATVTEQDAKLEELRKMIAEEQAVVDDLAEKLDEERATKTKEEARNRLLQQQFTALTAKKEFIDTEYDYSKSVEGVGKNLNVFSEIIRSNNTVNETVTGFIGKVDVVSKEVEKINALKFTGGF